VSEVDRLSNSGLYPALPIADRQGKERNPHAKQQPPEPPPEDVDSSAARRRPPKSLIDEYA
jgi:hypothetical protein